MIRNHHIFTMTLVKKWWRAAAVGMAVALLHAPAFGSSADHGRKNILLIFDPYIIYAMTLNSTDLNLF